MQQQIKELVEQTETLKEAQEKLSEAMELVTESLKNLSAAIDRRKTSEGSPTGIERRKRKTAAKTSAKK
jgi:predicted RNase H-like HicB family nuclease